MDRDKILLTPGPLTTTLRTKLAMLKDWGSWDSTPRQIWLQRALDLPTPAYLHLPLVLDEHGHKLGKSHASMPVDATDPLPALRAALRFLGQPEHPDCHSVSTQLPGLGMLKLPHSD